MENKYQSEIDEFHKNFDRFRGKRIVLYGIGRYTATLVDGVKDHRFVGLMDRDTANIGKIIFGLPILSLEEAEEKADMIVINTSGTYWEVIYQRIKHAKIPVYFLNGKLAEEKKAETVESDYWNHSLEEWNKKIEEAEVVSFDFYDTLFLRKIYNPTDVFLFLEEKWNRQEGTDLNFAELRNQAKADLDENYTLDQLYEAMEKLSKLSHSQMELFKRMELALEKRLLVPRKPVLESMKTALAIGKEVYVISDMYLPRSFFAEALKEQNMEIKIDNLLISCEEGKSKRQQDLWKRYAENLVKGRKALHIGDDEKSDIEGSRIYGIDSYKAVSMQEMLRLSSLREIEPEIRNLEQSKLMGILFAEMFQDPFILIKDRGKVKINTPEEMGFLVFGPVIAGFLSWLDKVSGKDGVETLVFLSRDGYFLQKDYEEYCVLSGKRAKSKYLGISRQLAMTASVQTEEELWDFIKMPYSGTPAELLEDRFDIKPKAEDEDKDLTELYEIYKEQIWEYVRKIRKNYIRYLNKQNLNSDCAIVDLGFYGNNQRYLNALTGLSMRAYYFNADLSEENPNARKNLMKACFQSPEDKKGAKSNILEKMIFLESFLTAPYGMVKAISEEGDFVCARKRKNQKYFSVKERIHDGVRRFLKEYLDQEIDGEKGIDLIDKWYGLCMDGKVDFAEEIRESFYNDNAMMNRFEANLFE